VRQKRSTDELGKRESVRAKSQEYKTLASCKAIRKWLKQNAKNSTVEECRKGRKTVAKKLSEKDKKTAKNTLQFERSLCYNIITNNTLQARFCAIPSEVEKL